MAVSALAASTTVYSCVDDSVTLTATDNIKTVTIDLVAGTVNTTYTNCKTATTLSDSSAGTEVQNGPTSFSFTAAGFSLSLGNSSTHYTDKITRDSDSRVVSNTDDNSTVTGVVGGTLLPCPAGNPVPSSINISIDGTLLDQEDSDINGVFDINESDSLTSVALASTINAIDDTNCEATDFAMSMTGGVALTDNLNSKNNISMTIPVNTPLAIADTAVTAPVAGDNVTVSGSFTCSSNCFSGSLTIATTTTLFTPTGSDCPTSGVVSVSGDVTGTVTYTDPATSVGGVAVTVTDSSGTSTYKSCSDVGACI